jgi:ABC-type microcin C transport system permease subunit YejE
MFNFVEMVLAGVGAGLILVALTFVSALIGVLVNAMIALFAGPVIDQVLARKSAR